MKTLTINNFGGRLTRYNDGDINSGLAKYMTTFGADPFADPGNLTWGETPIQIDSAGSVITDLIMAGKERLENGVSYVYAIGHTGRLYKIQVNDPNTYNPNYDNPVLLATLTSNSPTFTRGGSLDFFGSTERIYIGHDKGVTRIDFAGTNETFVGALGSWTQTVPRPFEQFVGKLYVGNGPNLAEIDSTATVTTYTKLSPGFPDNTQVRDIDTSVDGNYLETVVTRLPLTDLTSTAVDTNLISNSESYIFKWNGTDTGYTAFSTFPSFSLNANTVFGPYQYTFGYDVAGAAVFNPVQKIISPLLFQAPLPNAIGCNANLVGWTAPEFSQGVLKASQFIYGSLDNEVGTGWWRILQMSATSPETNVIRIPYQQLTSNFFIAQASNGYAGGVVSSGKIYFSTLESSPGPTTAYRLYKWLNVASGQGTAIAGVYETQNQLFSKKQSIKEVRFYTEPLATNNSFTLELIGSSGGVITGSSKTFTVGSNVTAGQDYIWYNPACAPTYTVGLRVTNLGTANWTGMKCEIDYDDAGK